MSITHRNCVLEFNNLLHRYTRLIVHKYKPIAENCLDEFSPSHLLWMITEIKKDNMPWPKVCRWLGYIQGILAFNNIIVISEEREITRVFLPTLDDNNFNNN